MAENDLFSQLKEATTPVDEKPVDTQGFVAEPEPVAETEHETEHSAPVEQKPSWRRDKHEKMAKTWVRMVNVLLTKVGTLLYKKSILRDDDEEICKAFEAEHEHLSTAEAAMAAENDPKVKRAMQRYLAFIDAKKQLPLQDDEKRDLEEALADFTEFYKHEIGPGPALMMTAGMILASRADPIINPNT